MENEKHILVVDEDPTILETICEDLLIQGFNVLLSKCRQMRWKECIFCFA